MDRTETNAHRLLQLMESMRSLKPGPGFELLHQLNLSFSHMRALHLLAAGEVLPMKDLADRLCLTPPSVTALTRRLVQTGLARREAHAEDSRVALISLTEEGRALLTQLYNDQLARMRRMLEGLSAEEQELFLDLLARAVAAARASV